MSSAVCSNLDQSKILPSGNGLKMDMQVASLGKSYVFNSFLSRGVVKESGFSDTRLA